MSKILKAAIIGYGYMGEIRSKVIEKTPNLELMGILDPSSVAREKIENCRIFNSFEELVKQDIEIIFVCTPNRYSPQYCIDSMNMGRHVFCEKPPGRNIEDIKKIIRTERENPSVKLMFGFNHRFHPGVMRAKVIVDSGRLGKIINIRGLYGKSGGKNFRDSVRSRDSYVRSVSVLLWGF